MQSTSPLILRKPLAATSLQMPALGFGAAPIGNLYRAMSDEQALATLAAARTQGMVYIDTAPHYGFGLSEARLGASLRGHTGETILSSKVGRLLVPTDSTAPVRHGFVNAPALEPIFDYSYDGVMRSFESSLRRLQVDHIDILLAHDLGALTQGADHPMRFREFMDGGYKAMRFLREQGLITAIGMGTNEWQVCEEALAEGDFDVFLLAGRYSLLEQTACDSFLPLCSRRGCSVIAGGPFNSGILALGVSGAGPHYYNYESAPDAVIQRVARLESVCAEFDVALPAAALQFPGAHPQVCSVIAGFANPEQVAQAIAWFNQSIPLAFWQRLRELELLHPDAPVPCPLLLLPS